MSNAIKKAEELIEHEDYAGALKLARKRHGRDDIESYLTILDKLIEKDYLQGIEEKGLYYQYYDENHDNADYGEKYFDKYLEKQPKSINVICDKALSRFNKNKIDEALKLMDDAYINYDTYSEIEKPRISKKEVKMAKIELLIQSKQYKEALYNLNNYEKEYGTDEKVYLHKGVMLQIAGKNKQSIEYLDKSLENDVTVLALNAKGNALYELGDYKKALKNYKICISNEGEVKDDLGLLTNFNYKAAYCEIELGNKNEAIKYLNKTINMLNEHGRLPKDIESIYQKCSFEKENILKSGNVRDQEFKKTKFLKSKVAIILLIIIFILYIILKMLGY